MHLTDQTATPKAVGLTFCRVAAWEEFTIGFTKASHPRTHARNLSEVVGHTLLGRLDGFTSGVAAAVFASAWDDWLISKESGGRPLKQPLIDAR